MWPAIRSFLLDRRTVLIAYIAIALVAGIQALLLGPHTYSGMQYLEYNNYVIFKQSFYHLLAGKNLYVLYPAEQWDLYKYSPSFSLAMGALAYLPDYIGLNIWNLANALALLAAVRMLPIKQDRQTWLLWFCLAELLTSMQNSQSNGLMAGLMIAAYAHMERGKPQWATLWLVIATFIKVYGAVGFCIFLFYPGKVKFLLWAALWTVLVAAMPLVVNTPQQIVWQYQNWVTMMKQDEAASYGLSVMGWLHTWFGVKSGKSIVSIVGLLLFLLPLARVPLYKDKLYRMLFVAFMLLWVIIFNHKAESPTFIIAVAGAGIWYFSGAQVAWRSVLLALVVVFTCLSPTDLFPPWVREHLFLPYTVKAIPCILLWCIVLVQLMTMKRSEVTEPGNEYSKESAID